MLATTHVTLSEHVRQRFSERVRPVSEDELLRVIRQSRPAGRGDWERIRQQHEALTGRPMPRPNRCLFLFHRATRTLFVLACVSVGHFIAVTCWPVAS